MWFYARNRQRLGPVPFEELRWLAVSGSLQPDDMVLQAGSQQWVLARSLSGLFAADPIPLARAIVSPPSTGNSDPVEEIEPRAPFARLVQHFSGKDGPPWNPTTLGVLGILFGIPWLGTLLAINYLRLRMPQSGRRALGIAGATTLLIVLRNWLPELLLIPAVLACFILLWALDVRPQRQAYARRIASGTPTASWRLPVLAGVAWSGLLVLYDSMTQPLSPLEVSERFARACQRGDADVMRRYADERMHFAIALLPVLERGSQDGYFKLLGEGWGRDGKHYEVDFTRGFRLAESNIQVRGTLWLLPHGRSWQIQEMLYHPIVNDAIQDVPVSSFYLELEEKMRKGKHVTPPLTASSTDTPSALSEKEKPVKGESWFFANVIKPFSAPLISGLAAAAGMGALALWRRWRESSGPRDQALSKGGSAPSPAAGTGRA